MTAQSLAARNSAASRTGKTLTEEQRQRRKGAVARRHDEAVAGFDNLPDSAGIRAKAAATVLGISVASLWRWVQAGRLHPRKVGPNTTVFRVSELRRLLGGNIDE